MVSAAFSSPKTNYWFPTHSWFQVIGECHSTQINDEVAAKYRLINGSQDSEIFLEFCLHTVLYQTPSQGSGISFTISVVNWSFNCFYFHSKQQLISFLQRRVPSWAFNYSKQPCYWETAIEKWHAFKNKGEIGGSLKIFVSWNLICWRIQFYYENPKNVHMPFPVYLELIFPW